MKLDVVTIFPKMVEGPLAEGSAGRAIAKGLLDVRVHDLRDFTTDRHRVVDDLPFGGGPGMVLKPEPLFAAVDRLREERGTPDAVILTSPDGERLTHGVAARLSALDHVVILCGRYEGGDERGREQLATEAISIGECVRSGGGLPARGLVGAGRRQVPGLVGDVASVRGATFARGGLLDFPQYTRPAESRGLSVPAVLLSGHHAEIEKWRREQALERTRRHRPDLL